MAETANIQILRGPDEGKVFSLADELVNLGRGSDNEIALTDESLEEHQASILRRNGRFAIYTPVEGGVEVDGADIPTDQWVWLPEKAQLRLSDSTTLQFRSKLKAPVQTDADTSAAGTGELPPDVPPPRRKSSRRKSRRNGESASRKPTRKRKVAKFITDQAGDHLVRLGEDGKLPELALAEAAGPRKAARQSGERSSPLLYVAVGISLLLSLALLFLDTGPSGSSESELRKAREKIRDFYGNADNLEPYQQSLREAQRAYAAGNRNGEYRAYKHVLDLLNSEDIRNSHSGLTGDTRRDMELRKLIGILLNRPR